MKNTGITGRVTMLPAKEATHISSHKHGNPLEFSQDIPYAQNITFQHLFVTHTDDIMVGAVRLANGLWIQGNGENTKVKGDILLASSDKVITPRSWLPLSFLSAYVQAYCDGQPITEIELETFSKEPRLATGEIALGSSFEKGALKIRPEGSVVCHQAKSYTKEQMMNAVAFGRNLGMLYPDATSKEQAELRNKYIQEFIDSDFKF